jgi:hypothetical protein
MAGPRAYVDDVDGKGTRMSSTRMLLRRIAERAETEPEVVLPVLRLLAGEIPDDTTTAEPDPALRSVALQINRTRVQQAQRDFVAHAWSAERVAEHLGVHSRQAVAQRRARGTLLGARVGQSTYYPAWQFGPEGLAAGFDRIRTLLGEAGLLDARTADDALRMPHSELGGRTLLDLWEAGAWEELEAWLGDIGTWQR